MSVRRARTTQSRHAVWVMWAGIAGSVALLVVLLRLGWGGDAWSLAAAVLFVVCIGVCVWTMVIGNRAARSIDAAMAELAEARRRLRAPTRR